jgi:hypothetical protein
MTNTEIASIVSAIATVVSCLILLWTAFILRAQVKLLGRQIADSSEAQRVTIDSIGNQTAALLAAAKANALSYRIAFYGAQIDFIRSVAGATGTLWQEQEHLVYHLDRVLDSLEVGLNNRAEHSPHNDRIGKWRENR